MIVNVNLVFIVALLVLVFASLVGVALVRDALRSPGGIKRLAGAVLALGVFGCVAAGSVWPGGVMLAGLALLRVLDRRISTAQGDQAAVTR